jgi:hypothetical protein
MVSQFRFVLVVAAGVTLTTLPVHGQVLPGQSKAITKCESGTGSALSKFTDGKAKCISKCIKGARKTSGPFAGCFVPYADPATSACITGSLKGVEVKGGAAIAKVCAAASSCPKCYVSNGSIGGAGCTDASGANPWVQTAESVVDEIAMEFYCEESGFVGPIATPSPSEAKCEDGVAKAFAKAWSAQTKCFQKCNANLAKGKITGSCDPFSLTDPTTIACVTDPKKSPQAKAAAAIDKACFIPVATAPSCYTDLGFTNGAIWASIAANSPGAFISTSNCGSPSGAFLQ